LMLWDSTLKIFDVSGYILRSLTEWCW
jgi:hypothetical protein